VPSQRKALYLDERKPQGSGTRAVKKIGIFPITGRLDGDLEIHALGEMRRPLHDCMSPVGNKLHYFGRDNAQQS
jgi:hypothetical protein